MPRTTLDTLNRRVVTFFRKHAARYGLDRQTVEAHYILNWGGFVNASFRLTDGVNLYHLKLADNDDSLERLERWRELSPILASRYHAPRLLDWVRIPYTNFEGALFEYIHGQPADLAVQPEVLNAVLGLLARLHADQELASALASIQGQIPTCTDTFLSVYIDRFDEDLATVAGDLPPFVPLTLLDWMMGETRELEGLARDLPAFQQPATSPTHGDLWPSNILVSGGNEFSIID
jgi:fructosamine-3-kinase